LPDDKAWWIALHTISNMGPATFYKLLEKYGDPRNVFERADEGELQRIERIPPSVVHDIASGTQRVEAADRMLRSLRRRGIEVLTVRDSGYPAMLKNTETPPPLLYCAGEYTEEDMQSVAIIGSTDASAEGIQAATDFGASLAREGCTVVSGYARGIDSAGHLGALRAGGRTIFALPTGINRFSPREGFPPVSVLRERGVILSELPPDHPWTSAGALARNRITAALSRAVLVIEAREQSGTLHTVGIALRQGIPVFVLRRGAARHIAPGNEIAIARGGIPVESPEDTAHILRVARGGRA